jgi:hypothetical protein
MSDFFQLVPNHIRESDSVQGYEMVARATENEWNIQNDLIAGLSLSRSPFAAPESLLPLLARMLGVSSFGKFPVQNRRQLLSIFTELRSMKGTALSLKVAAALMGYDIDVKPLFCSFAYPNILNPLDSANDAYFSQSMGTFVNPQSETVSGIPVYPASHPLRGEMVPQVFEFYKFNNVWPLLDDVQNSNFIRLVSNPHVYSPRVGQNLVLEGVVHLYTIVSVEVEVNSTLKLTLDATIVGPVSSGKKVCIFKPGLIYASSFFDVKLVVKTGEETATVSNFRRDFQSLSFIIPFRDQLRSVVPFYKSVKQWALLWADLSDYDNNAFTVDTAHVPVLSLDSMSGGTRPSLLFTGAETLSLTSSPQLNDSVFSYKILGLVLRTGSDVNTRQVVYTQGNTVRGISVYLLNGQLFFGMWNTDGVNAWGPSFDSVGILPNCEYSVILMLDAVLHFIEIMVSGSYTHRIEGPAIKDLLQHPAEASIGGVKLSTRFHDSTQTSAGSRFSGNIAEIVQLGIPFSPVDRFALRKRFNERYSLSVPAGSVLVETWTSLEPTLDISALVGDGNRLFPDSPNELEFSKFLSFSHSNKSNFGRRIRGYFRPIATGLYRFSTSSSGHSQLLFSLTELPEDALQICDCAGGQSSIDYGNGPSQISSPLSLVQGQRYYFEILNMETHSNGFLGFGSKIVLDPDTEILFTVQRDVVIPLPNESRHDTIIPNKRSFDFSTSSIGSSRVTRFELNYLNMISRARLLFTASSLTTASSIEFRINGHLVRVGELEANVPSGQYWIVDLPVKHLILGTNTLTLKLMVVNPTKLDGIQIFTDITDNFLDSDKFSSDVVLKLDTNEGTVRRLAVEEKRFQSLISQADADGQAIAELTSELLSF